MFTCGIQFTCSCISPKKDWVAILDVSIDIEKEIIDCTGVELKTTSKAVEIFVINHSAVGSNTLKCPLNTCSLTVLSKPHMHDAWCSTTFIDNSISCTMNMNSLCTHRMKDAMYVCLYDST